MALTGKQRLYLRGLAHHRKPVVTLGASGFTAAVQTEIEQALNHHELLKIKILSGDRQDRHQVLDRICQATTAEAVQEIGRIAVIYRPAAEPRIRLPD